MTRKCSLLTLESTAVEVTRREFIKEMDQLADEGKQILFLTEQFPNLHRLYGRVDHTNWIDADGDLSALVTPELEEVVTQWMNERNKWQTPKSTAEVFMDNMNELIELVRMEVAMLNCSRHAFVVETKAEEDLPLSRLRMHASNNSA